MVGIKSILSVFMLLMGSISHAAGQVVMDFSTQNLASFQEKSFVGKTQYQIVQYNDERVLKAVTNTSASALYRSLDIDLTLTPYLNWRWRVDNTYAIDDQTTKQGDDYPARIYVVIKEGIFPWQSKALNYVWSNTAVEQPYWFNPFTKNAIMIPVRSGIDELGQWRSERVNVVEDFYRVFGRPVKKAHGVAIMSDSDNSGGSAVAYYGNISFSN